MRPNGVIVLQVHLSSGITNRGLRKLRVFTAFGNAVIIVHHNLFRGVYCREINHVLTPASLSACLQSGGIVRIGRQPSWTPTSGPTNPLRGLFSPRPVAQRPLHSVGSLIIVFCDIFPGGSLHSIRILILGNSSIPPKITGKRGKRELNRDQLFCEMLDHALLSDALGYLSILCWLGAQFPWVSSPISLSSMLIYNSHSCLSPHHIRW
jgi:hypothetical protein